MEAHLSGGCFPPSRGQWLLSMGQEVRFTELDQMLWGQPDHGGPTGQVVSWCLQVGSPPPEGPLFCSEDLLLLRGSPTLLGIPPLLQVPWWEM